MPMLILLVLVCSIAASTREGRAAAARQLKPWGRWLGVVALILWAAMLWPLIRAGP